jgi:predicted nuclease with TOPRIM domain
MNQPHDPLYDKLEQRVEKIEEVFDGIVKNEEIIIKLSKRQNFNVQELSGKVGNIELDIGDLRERTDKIEQALERHDKRFDRIEGKQDVHTELLGQILALLQKKGE